MERIGVVLAGGEGVRMRPTTLALNKHLLPVYDRPMVMLPIDFMLDIGIKRIVVVTNKYDMGSFTDLLASEYAGKDLYIVEQDQRKGVAAALSSAHQIAYGSPVLVMLGDNLFYGKRFSDVARNTLTGKESTVTCVAVKHPESTRESCVVGFSDNGRPVSLTEKPKKPASDYVLTGMYAYPSSVFDTVESLKPSSRGELEITDLNKEYMSRGELVVRRVELDGKNQWLDLGSHDKLMKGAMLRYATAK